MQPVSSASRDLAPRTEITDRTRRATDRADAETADRRGIAPAERSRSTVIVYDGRAVDRRQIGDRRKMTACAEPSSEFVTQVVAHEHMLLDLRPDPIETRQAQTAYRDDQDGSDDARTRQIDLSI